MQLIEEYPILTKGRCYYTDHEIPDDELSVFKMENEDISLSGSEWSREEETNHRESFQVNRLKKETMEKVDTISMLEEFKNCFFDYGL